MKKLFIVLLVLVLCGCARPPVVIDSFCFWAKPIPYTQKDVEMMSDRLAMGLDNYQAHYEYLCLKQDYN
jgi:hypothetical protein